MSSRDNLPVQDPSGNAAPGQPGPEQLSRLVEELRQRERQYDALFNVMTEGLALHEIICDESGKPCDYRFLKVNPAFEQLTGLKDVVGRTVLEVLPGVEPYWIELLGQVALTGAAAHIERFAAPLNRYYDVYAYRPAERQFACVFTDVTDRKNAAEELRRHQAELAQVARRSTMGEMAATLAHELNQPLQAITNYARGGIRRLAKHAQQEKDPDLAQALEQISAEAGRAAKIIRRVRALVEDRAPRLSRVSLNALVEEVVRLSKSELEHRRVKVVLDLTESTPFVLCDPIQIEQVLLNLTRNAIEALDETPQQGKVLTLRTTPADDDMLQVDVGDRGKGIQTDLLEKVFEPFFTTKPQGMGMGLAISRSIVEHHNGRLWASSNPDCGCTFHFTLPRARSR